ncbi:hypothetical protein [Polyangium sp. 15x6]|uniref:hypothetical protein n=1 Tax=Polyangium sp. 15x6 TaxID=3042687 RepID=UPI00249B0FFA|nr:hypothetical protein [Polyangium sp. 15x6]MDI3284249.1 hypothetical protein [Polyangium sp. 15x6]
MAASNPDRRPPVFLPLLDALDFWHRADEAFLAERSCVERGLAMTKQLQARCVVYRLSEIELLIEHPLRAMLVEEGIWSPHEALDRLDLVDFAARHNALCALAPVLPPECLRRALDMASRPGFGDDERWEIDRELVEVLNERMSRAKEHEPRAAQEASLAPRGVTPSPAAEPGKPTLARILLACRAKGRDEWLESSFPRALEYVVNDLEPQHAAEFAQDRTNPLFADLRRALLASGRELWSRPWFRQVFDAEERRGHLRHVLERRERRGVLCFDALLEIATRLRPTHRATVLRSAIAHREARGDERAPVDLARVVGLVEGEERAALLARIEAWLDEAETEERLSTLTTLMSAATPAEAVDWVRRGLGWIATEGTEQWSDVETFFEAIAASTWAALVRTEWEPALQAGGRNWDSYDVRLVAVSHLPEEARRLLEERGLPALLEKDAYTRLVTGKMIVHALSWAGRAQLIASLLSLDAVTWREAASAVGPIARHLDDAALERLCRTLGEPNPEGNWRVEAGLAEAWAARGMHDRAAVILERITDDEDRAEARMAVAIAAGDARAVLSSLDRSLSRPVYRDVMDAALRWASERRDSTWAEALAACVDEPLSASDRLHAWAALWPLLSAHARSHLAPKVERAVDDVLADDDRQDDALCAIAEVLSELRLIGIWKTRATASSYRHALALFEDRFCEFMLPDNHRHSCVLHFVQALGGERALLEHASNLASISPA